MKRFFVSKWAQLSIGLLILVPLFNILILMTPAQAGSPALQSLVDKIQTKCKDLNQGTDTWKECQNTQNSLKTLADCSGTMFGPENAQGKRSYVPQLLEECQTKINDVTNVTQKTQNILNNIKKECNKVNNVKWELCEGQQNQLKVIGCSGTMFEKGDGGWSWKQADIDACQKIIDAIKTDPATKPGEGQAPGSGSSASGNSDEAAPCLAGPLGWLLCPVINAMADVIRGVASFIDSMMQFRFLIGTESGPIIRGVVSNFTTVANLLLLAGFLIIIFSQSTSFGLSNYGIKKMLPRLVIAAILINVSFYICAFAIDISNIVGNSIMGFITGQGASNASIGAEVGKSVGGDTGTFNKMVSGLLATAALAVLLFMFIAPLLLGIFITFVLLVARQLILIFLVILAPLAFAAWLLPNTETWFTRWRKLFTSMLVAYPLVMGVFGVALFASKFIKQIATADNGDAAGSNNILQGDDLASLISLLVLAIPLIALPFILKSASSALAQIGRLTSAYGGKQLSDKLGQAGKSGIKKVPGIRAPFEMAEQRKANREYAYNKAKLGRSVRRGSRTGVPGALTKAGVAGFGVTETGRLARGQAAAAAIEAQEKLRQDDIKKIQTGIQYGNEFKNLAGADADIAYNKKTGVKYGQTAYLTERALSALKEGDSAGAIAAKNLLMNQGADGLQALRYISDAASTTVTSPDASVNAGGALRELAADLNSADYTDLKTKAPELLGFAGSAGQDSYKDSNSLNGFSKVSAQSVGGLDTTSLEYGMKKGKIDDKLIADVRGNEIAWAGIPQANRDAIEEYYSKKGVAVPGAPATKPTIDPMQGAPIGARRRDTDTGTIHGPERK